MNKKILILISVGLLFSLVSCNEEKGGDYVEKKENKKEVLIDKEVESEIEEDMEKEFENIFKELEKEINYSSNSDESADNKTVKKESSKELSVDYRCIGCNKCVIIAPNNFTMDYETRKANVISQKNMFSKEVTRAKKVCPTQSIHIS